MSTDASLPPPPLRLLGAPQLGTAAGALPFAPERPFLLLAVLACRRDWVRRDELADLLYPGRDIESARSNLRKVIFLARKLDGVGTIEQRGDLLRWAPDSDLQRFEAACDSRRWADAVAAHGGPLLLGLDAAWPTAAADWLAAERQRLLSRWHEACTRRLAELADAPEAAAALAQAMLRQDPLDDLALQALGRAQQALGQAEAALETVAGYAERLSAAGLEPSAAVAQLQRDLRSATPAAAAPAAPAGLLGRRHELAQLRTRLATPDCRVLTLLGPPGVGKSALARAAAAELAGTWVPLEDLAGADAVPARIAQQLALALDGRQPPWAALAQALGTRQVLLVLDNAEPLALADGLAQLLDRAAGVQLLATARAPLGLAGEWRLTLDGLPLPDLDETDPEVLRANDAVQLFERRALPLAPGFDLAAEAADVVRLIHEVDGLPLAIELLAAWRRLMPVQEILAELAASLDLLDGSTPNERSVRASFGRAWQQLGPVEQRLLAQLALLPGPVDRSLVREVLQAPLPALAVLVDRSLLRAEGDGQFALHPLIRRCAEPLAADAQALLERHARHVAARFARSDKASMAELVHARAAWQWALQQGDAAVLATMALAYQMHLQRTAQFRQGEQDLEHARQLLQPRVPADGPLPPAGPVHEAALALGRVLQGLALMRYSLGALESSCAVAQACEQLGERLGDDLIVQAALTRQGGVHWQRGQYDAAADCFQRAHDRLDPADSTRRTAALGWMALVDKARGHYAQAAATYERVIATHRAAGRLADHLYLLNNLGNLLRLLGRHDAALDLLREARELVRQHGRLSEEPFLLTNIALVHETQGTLAEGCSWAELAVAAGREHGEPMIEAAARLARARLAAALQRDPAAALHDVLASLEIAARIGSEPLRVQCLASAGVVLAHGGRRADGFVLTAWAESHPVFTRSEREDLARHLQRLAPQPEELAAARAACPPHDAADAVDRLLQRLAAPPPDQNRK